MSDGELLTWIVMAGKPSDEKERARALLSANALPKIEIPKSARHERREFKLPDHLNTPIPERASASESAADSSASTVPKRRRRPSTAKFRDRTLGWFQTGEELETQESMAPSEYDRPEAAGRPWVLVAAVGAAVVAIATIWWLM